MTFLPVFRLSQFHLYRLTAIPVLALILVHFVVYQKLPFQPGYNFPLVSFFILIATGLLVCQTNCEVYNRMGSLQLTKAKSAAKIVRQFVLGWVATVAVFTAIYLLLLLTRGGEFDWVQYLGYTAMMLGISSLENAVLMLRDFYGFLQDKKSPPLTLQIIEASSANEMLLNIPSGKKIMRIPAVEVAYIHSANGIVSFQTFAGQKITSDFSALDEVEAGLSGAPFFRLNRQYLANRHAIRKIAEVENRKIGVTLQPNGKPQDQFTVNVSRYKAKEFKHWLTELGR